MKTIFVTVQEFINNGGEIEIGRVLYNKEQSAIGMFYGFDNIGCVIINSNKKSVGTVVAYVQIDCTPIYK